MTRNRLLTAAATFLLSGCATTTLYAPLKVDPGTGLYPTFAHVAPADAQAFVTTENPRAFRAVVLSVQTNVRPANLSFMIRQALAQEGITRVYTSNEFARMTGYPAAPLAAKPGPGDPEPDRVAIRKYSKLVGPVLIVRFGFVMDSGHARTMLDISDGLDDQVLLKIDQRRLIWSNWDKEALFPVLNELRQWVNACTSAGV
jgi:hypothetical protein